MKIHVYGENRRIDREKLRERKASVWGENE